MEKETLKAAANPAKANALVAEALSNDEPQIEPAKITAGSNIEVVLPGGYVTPAGEVYQTVEVKELNGRDEEYIAKVAGTNKMYSAILSRGTVTIGDLPVTQELLGRLLLGDRDAIMLGIFRATYGDTAELGSWCSKCGNYHLVTLNVTEDIKVKGLLDPVNDRTFTVNGKAKEFLVTLPTGVTQGILLDLANANNAEQLTALLEQTVLEIDGKPVLSKLQIQDLGIADRQKIAEELSKRTPGPQWDEVILECPDCDGELVVPISLGALFRF
jgi:hypothetical protein